MNKFKNVIGVDTMPTSYRKNAQPEMNHAVSAEKLDILPVWRSKFMNEMGYPREDFFSDKEGPDSDV